jgi:hypothetical protein
MDDPQSPLQRTDTKDGSAVAEWVRRLVRLMDDAYQIPGTNIRIGWDSILGLVLPAAGDAVTAVSQVALLLAAVRARAPWIVIGRMLLNVGLDSAIGSVPLVGDLFDVGFKANRKNLELLERLHTTPGQVRKARKSDYLVLGIAVALMLCLIAVPVVVISYLLGSLAAQF